MTKKYTTKQLKDKFISQDGTFLSSNLIDFFEEDLLNHEKFPKTYMEFLKEVFSTSEYFEADNLWKVLHMLTTECLSQEQFHELSYLISSQYSFYREEMLCDISCDFIARCCKANYALSLFESMYELELDDVHQRCILMGLNIMSAHEKKDTVISKKIENLAKEIQGDS